MAETKPKPKPKIKKESVEMPKQKPKERVKNFNEVALGYDEAQAFFVFIVAMPSAYFPSRIHQMSPRRKVR